MSAAHSGGELAGGAMSEYRPLQLCPISISDAKEFVTRHHRHHPAPQGGLFAVAVASDGEIVGVAVIGRPVARGSDNGWTAEVTRTAVLDGYPNACSKLYGAAWRACRALGYRGWVESGWRSPWALLVMPESPACRSSPAATQDPLGSGRMTANSVSGVSGESGLSHAPLTERRPALLDGAHRPEHRESRQDITPSGS